MDNLNPRSEWFLEAGEGIVERISKSSIDRSDMKRYNGVTRNLHSAIFYSAKLKNTVHYFGSRVSGLSTSYSDLDLFVETDHNKFMSPNNQEAATSTLMKIKQALHRSRDWQVKLYLPNAKVPLLRVIYLRTNFECDIIASNGISVCLCKMLKYLNSIQPEIIPLFHYIRIWLSINGIKMKRYIQYLLVLFYLQNISFMPTIELIQRSLPKKLIDGWEVQYDTTRTLKFYKIDKIKHYKNYVLGFFQFYSQVEFSEYVLSLYSGTFIDRAQYRGENFNLKKSLCIAGPIDRGRNSAQTVGVQTLKNFQKICKLSCDFLTSKGWKN